MTIEEVLRGVAKFISEKPEESEWVFEDLRESGLLDLLKAGQALRDTYRYVIQTGRRPEGWDEVGPTWDAAIAAMEEKLHE